MKVTNTQKGPRGLNTETGPRLVEAGQTVDVEMTDAEVKSAKASGWFEFGAPAKDAGKSDKSEKGGDEPSLKAEHHGGGKFNITKGETVVQSGLSKADADAFNAMSDEEKAAYVAQSKD